jgi:DNA repair exonuclease SbcCD ATPase subunit
MTQASSQPLEPSDLAEAAPDDGDARFVPVGESKRYRRRAQAAEGKLAQVEQQLTELQAQLQASQQQAAQLQSQQEQARKQVQTAEGRMAAQAALARSGVADVDAAALLLSQRVKLEEPMEAAALAEAIEQLLADKPYLRATPPLPPPTAAARSPQAGRKALLDQLAQRAARSGDRRDLAEYLRMRRQAGGTSGA